MFSTKNSCLGKIVCAKFLSSSAFVSSLLDVDLSFVSPCPPVLDQLKPVPACFMMSSSHLFCCFPMLFFASRGLQWINRHLHLSGIESSGMPCPLPFQRSYSSANIYDSCLSSNVFILYLLFQSHHQRSPLHGFQCFSQPFCIFFR